MLNQMEPEKERWIARGWHQWRLTFCVGLLWMVSAMQMEAFSLMGPYAEWMDQSKGFRRPEDIGGAMGINEEYRWNVPVITYAFDESFLNYFGSNGVAAVEEAIQTLNELPPASSLDLTNFPTRATSANYRAMAWQLYDLKSLALSLLVQHLGLTEPVRHVFDLRRWDPVALGMTNIYFYTPHERDWAPGIFGDVILEQNYDPQRLLPSHYVNGVLFSGYLRALDPDVAEIVEFPVDAKSKIALCVPACGWGDYSYEGEIVRLTQDDVGGLRYLLSTNNTNLERLQPDVQGTGTNENSYVDLALRPGIEKITFVRQDYDALLNRWLPIKKEYSDTYIVDGTVMHQQVERVVTQPDIVFSMEEFSGDNWRRLYTRTDTSNWWNSAGESGTGAAGPGVIRPPVRIAFQKLGTAVVNAYYPSRETSLYNYRWASFNESTNLPVVYPCETAQIDSAFMVRLRLYNIHNPIPFVDHAWNLELAPWRELSLEVSTNLVDWTSVAGVTNSGGGVEWYYYMETEPQGFLRVRQP